MFKTRLSLFCLALTVGWYSGIAPGPARAEAIRLWSDKAPGAIGDDEADRPTIQIYQPDEGQSNGAAVVVCPGGGYGALAMDHEGHQVARWLNRIGVTGVVLKYRLGPRYRHPAPLNDVQRAIRYVRANAESLGVDPKRIGVMGFSAGGHLASTIATHYDDGDENADDPIDRVGCRPDFAILGYPVVSLKEPYSHGGSRRNLLGNDPDPKLVESLSNEKQVTSDTPPTFLFHTGEDAGVPVENSLAFYAALRRAKVPAELHVYQFGPHGVGLAPGAPAVSGWPESLAQWLRGNGFLADIERVAVSGTVTVDGKPIDFGTITFIPDSKHEPVGWGRIRRGRFTVSVERGAVVGTNRVEIRNLGSVQPRKTVDDVELFTKENSEDEKSIQVEITPRSNELEFQIRR